MTYDRFLRRCAATAAQDQACADGVAAKRAGVPRNHCPSFVDAAMRDAWLDGWDSVPALPALEPLAKRFETVAPLVTGSEHA